MNISQQLAVIIKDAQDLHETSYDKEGAEKAQKELDAGTRTAVDFNEFYGISMRVASASACADAGEPELTELVHTLLFSSWNGAAEWVASVSK